MLGNPVTYRISPKSKGNVMSNSQRIPSYRRHRASGNAIVTIDGRDHYLGRWNTKASKLAYDALIAEWIANGRRLPTAEVELTVAEVCASYWRFAKGYYIKDNKPTGELHVIKTTLRRLKQRYGSIGVSKFGPLASLGV
jgi:hypothetical protein